MKTHPILCWLFALVCAGLGGCNYDFSLTAQPTRPVDERLIGNWIAANKDDPKEEILTVRRLDDSTYVVAMDHDLYRAFHSEFAGTAFLSVQCLQPGTDDRKYIYFIWQLSADGDHLSLKGVSNKVVPEETKSRDEAQRLIKANLTNPKLYGDEMLFTRK